MVELVDLIDGDTIATCDAIHRLFALDLVLTDASPALGAGTYIYKECGR